MTKPVAWMYVNPDGECEQIEYGEPFDDPSVTPLYTAPPQREPLARMKEMLEVQGRDGNWNYDSYMHGMYNGMEYMLSMVESREPVFREAPKKWLSKREWVSLTAEELAEISEFHFHGAFSGREIYEDIETKLKEKNT